MAPRKPESTNMANLNKYSPNKTFSQTVSFYPPQRKLSVRIKLISYRVFDCPLLFHQFLLLFLLLLLFTFLEAKTTSCAENHSFTQCLVVHDNQHLNLIDWKVRNTFEIFLIFQIFEIWVGNIRETSLPSRMSHHERSLPTYV